MGEASIEMMDVIHQKQSEADKALYVQFNYEPHLSQSKTNLEGRPIYEEREYILIMVPGDKDSIVHRPMSEMDRARFSERYRNWKNKVGNDTSEGTPLKMVPWLNSAQVRELEYFNCYTLEQLAAMADQHVQKFMGMVGLRQRARDFVAAAKEQAPLAQIRAEIEKKDDQLAAALKAIEEQSVRIKLLEDTLGKSKAA
jgi:hypothetical protein